jgi:hypothetical protein
VGISELQAQEVPSAGLSGPSRNGLVIVKVKEQKKPMINAVAFEQKIEKI